MLSDLGKLEDMKILHYNDVINSAMASQITSLTIIYSNVYSGTAQRNHQISASLAFVWGIHRWLVNSPHKRPITRKMFQFDDVIMLYSCCVKRLSMPQGHSGQRPFGCRPWSSLCLQMPLYRVVTELLAALRIHVLWISSSLIDKAATRNIYVLLAMLNNIS